MAHVVGPDGLDELIAILRADERTVIGPTIRDGVITHTTSSSRPRTYLSVGPKNKTAAATA